MVPEIGQISLILALCMAIAMAAIPLIGAQRGITTWVAMARPAAWGQLLFMATAYGCLTYGFLTHDFTVAYVAQNSNLDLPLIYRISGVWGAHEGSLLLWALTLSAWTAAVGAFSRSVPEVMIARVLAVMGMVSTGFLLFMLLTSNPFDRLVPSPEQGRDLNPLLQDPGLAFHPPMLYMGYVGFAVPFAFAIAAMIGGRLDAAWARWSRPWTNVAWVFLTLGIALGSWWAYYELGWGGWWFWDPVENASFMPWLVGTALMHSLAVTEKRGAFKAWTVLLAIFAFSLSLLGTFLVRSGVLTSVHAFASDPTRGVFILLFLSAVIGGSLLMYAWRAAQIRSLVRFDVLSRETGLLLNNVILVVAAASVLLGTLYPLVIDALKLGKLSVGPPYFNSVFLPLMSPLLALIGIGTYLRWKEDRFQRLRGALSVPLIAAAVLGGLFPLLMEQYDWRAAVGMTLALWVVFSQIPVLRERLSGGRSIASIPTGFWGMTLGHIGLAVTVVGITLTSLYSVEKDVRLTPGDTYTLGRYSFAFEGVTQYRGPNYLASQGTVVARKDGQVVATLQPAKRVYTTQGMPMTEAGIDAGLFRDLFVALGDELDGGAWAVRIYHKPFVRWIWLGALIMALGGIFAAADRRYRVLARRTAPAGGAAEAAR